MRANPYDRCDWCDEINRDHSPTDLQRCDEKMADPLVAGVEDECPKCGAQMGNPALHETWHRNLNDRLDAIDKKAGQYVSPPTYGGYR